MPASCSLISFTGYLWKVKTHNVTYSYATNNASLLKLISNPSSVHYKSRHFKISCNVDEDFARFGIWGVRKVLMHLLNLMLQRHDDVIFVTYKRLAKTDKKAVIWICVPIWQSRIIFLAACVQVIMMLFKYETFTMRQNFVFLFIYLFYFIQLSSDSYAPKLNNMNTITRCQIYSKLKVQPCNWKTAN